MNLALTLAAPHSPGTSIEIDFMLTFLHVELLRGIFSLQTRLEAFWVDRSLLISTFSRYSTVIIA